MKRLLSLKYSLEGLASLLAAAAFLGVLQSFIIGKHFVIPTAILFLAIVFGNLARFGLKDRAWAKHMLFWIFGLMTCHTFFALFWAGSARPGAAFGDAFYPVYGGFFIIVGFLCWQYANKNDLFV